MVDISKVLVANRGEIACRLIRACRQYGLETVAVYAGDDIGAPYARLADEAVELAAPSPAQAYTDIDAIVEAALSTGARAVHPGYGFLAENPQFARAVEEAGLVFIGPAPDTLALLGDKKAAFQHAASLGLPVPRQSVLLHDREEALRAAGDIGFPLLVKSPLGGGGLGCTRADDADELAEAFSVAVSQAENLYGSGSVYLERLVSRARHIEVQTLGDGRGMVRHVGTRDCSLQRRRQKVVEEAAAPAIPAKLEAELLEAAIELVSSLELRSAATVEFLVSGEGDFHFLEVNPRIQVEHPVTEMVFGLDLVRRQLDIACGRGLDLPDRPVPRGHSIEVRVYAEEPRTFMPAPGVLDIFRPPSGPGIRLDCGVEEGMAVSQSFDPLLCKLTVWDEDRRSAVKRLALALDEFLVNGTALTNLPLLSALARSDWFAEARYDTGTLEAFAASFEPDAGEDEARTAALLARGLDGRGGHVSFGPVSGDGSDPAGEGTSRSQWKRRVWRNLP